jgi:hypothetical protein
VKKVFATLIVGMGHHGYLQLVGGQEMIEYIITLCAIEPDDPVIAFHFFAASVIFMNP